VSRDQRRNTGQAGGSACEEKQVDSSYVQPECGLGDKNNRVRIQTIVPTR